MNQMTKHITLSKKILFKHYLILIIICTFTIAYSVLGVVRHNRFESLGYDLGIFDQIIWKYSHLMLPISTVKVPNQNILGDHFSPSYALLSPIFWFWNDVRALIIFQALAVASSAFPIYLMARSLIKDSLLSLVISVCYLLFYGFQNALLFDVHEIVFASALLPWLFYFLHTKRFFWFWFCSAVAIGFKEDVPIIIATFGLYSFLQYRLLRVAIISIFTSTVYFLLVTRLAIPHFSGTFTHASVVPRNLNDFIQVFVPMTKWVTVLWSLAPFAFTPVLNLSTFPMIAAHFLINWLDPRFFGRWGMALHYRAPLGPILTIATIWTIKNLVDRLKLSPSLRKISYISFSVLFLTLAVVIQVRLHLPLNNLLKKEYYKLAPWTDKVESLMKVIPRSASVATQNNFISHLTHREEVYLIWSQPKKFIVSDSPCAPKIECAWLKFDQVDYILLDKSSNQPASNFWGYSYPQVLEAINNLEYHGNYQEIKHEGDIYLYKRML